MSRGQVTYITSADTLNEFQTNINIDTNNLLLFTIFSADTDDYGVRSFLYDSNGVITSADRSVIGNTAYTENISKNIKIDITNNLLFVDYGNKIYSYLYNTSGIMTSADCFDTFSPSVDINGLAIDEVNSLLFASSNEFAAMSFTYNTSGIMVSAEEYGTSAGKICTDCETHLFILSGGCVEEIDYDPVGTNFYSYGSLFLEDNLSDIIIDDIRNIIFITRNINGGLISIPYGRSGLISSDLSATSTSPGGTGYGVAIDKTRQLVMNCNGIINGFNHNYSCSGNFIDLDNINSPDSDKNTYLVIDSFNKLIFTTDIQDDNNPYGRIRSFSYDWNNTFYADINNSYTETGIGTSANPFNETQLELFLNGTSAYNNSGYITSADTIRIKGDFIKSNESNLSLLENINSKATITSWEDKIPWSLYHTSAVGTSGCVMISQYEPLYLFTSNSADIDLTIEDGIINKPYINMDNINQHFIFKDCIIYNNLNLSIAANNILDFNGCTSVSGSNNYYGWQLLS